MRPARMVGDAETIASVPMMTGRTFSIFIVSFLAACATHRSPATVGKSPSPDMRPATPGELVFAGEVDKIDLEAGQITVQHWPLYKIFHLGSHCEVTRPDMNKATLSDLKTG